MRRLPLITLAASLGLIAALAPAARAGGASAALLPPERAGAPYRVETHDCGRPAAFAVAATAEGIVGGERRTLALRLQPGRAAGQFLLARQWPAEGRWVVRLVPARRPSATVLVPLDAQGRPGEAKYVWKSDTRRELESLLASR